MPSYKPGLESHNAYKYIALASQVFDPEGSDRRGQALELRRNKLFRFFYGGSWGNL